MRRDAVAKLCARGVSAATAVLRVVASAGPGCRLQCSANGKNAAVKEKEHPDRYSGHSLRAGLAAAAGDSGANLADLMRQTRHKSTQVALAYLRPADLWRNNVTRRVFGAAADGDG